MHQNPLPKHNIINMVKDEETVIESDDEDEYEVKIKASRLGDSHFRQEALLKGEIVDNLGEDSRKYNFQVKYTLLPKSIKNEVIVPDSWSGIDDETNLEEKALPKKKKMHQMMKECKGDEILYFGKKIYLNFVFLHYGSEGVLLFDDNNNNKRSLSLNIM